MKSSTASQEEEVLALILAPRLVTRVLPDSAALSGVPHLVRRFFKYFG
jgi:hypothetical protein